jgi:alpha-galactosidase/6-phospho-beta-glucosidase family protein
MLDPNTGATLRTRDIVAMVDDLIEAHAELIPDDIRLAGPGALER